jgi:hypothetical protein
MSPSGGFGCRKDALKVLFESRPVICPEFEDRDAPALQVLLMLEVLVGNDEHLKPFGLRAIEQITVAHASPANLDGGQYFMIA